VQSHAGYEGSRRLVPLNPSSVFLFAQVRFIDNPELAYVMQRYRECHDFYHVITGFPVSVGAEIVVKWFEMANFGLPVAALSAFFGPLRLTSAGRRRIFSTYVPWALKCGSSADSLMAVYWEKEWATPIQDLKARMGISEPPVPWREFRKGGAWR
jgi:ubiquinone biosynthesis protein COQ4